MFKQNKLKMQVAVELKTWGNSQGVRIPKNILDALHWAKNETLYLIAKNNKLIIEKPKSKPRPKIEDLFNNFEGTYSQEDIDWGEPQGKEVW